MPIIAIANIKSIDNIDKDFVIIMDRLQDLGNIGSVVRSAGGFGINEFIFSDMQTDGFHRKVIDSSRGLVLNS